MADEIELVIDSEGGLFSHLVEEKSNTGRLNLFVLCWYQTI